MGDPVYTNLRHDVFQLWDAWRKFFWGGQRSSLSISLV